MSKSLAESLETMYLEALKKNKKVWDLGEHKISNQAVPAYRSLLQVLCPVGTAAGILT